jgi:hypothetical protein
VESKLPIPLVQSTIMLLTPGLAEATFIIRIL